MEKNSRRYGNQNWTVFTKFWLRILMTTTRIGLSSPFGLPSTNSGCTILVELAGMSEK